MVGAALQTLLENGAETFYMGHGGPLRAKEVSRHAKYLATLG